MGPGALNLLVVTSPPTEAASRILSALPSYVSPFGQTFVILCDLQDHRSGNWINRKPSDCPKPISQAAARPDFKLP